VFYALKGVNMQFTIDLPNKLGEQLNAFSAPNDFIVKVLAQSLGFDLQNRAKPEFRIEDAFGLYQPERSVSLEEMEPLCCKMLRRLYSESNADFSDCIILAHVQKMGMKLSTFDKRLAKLSGATEVQTKK